MKQVLLGAAAALVIAAPGVAAADTSGLVGLSYNTLDDDNDGDKEDYLDFSGSVVTTLNGDLKLQFDGSIQDMGHGDHTDTHGTAVAHVFMRNHDFAFGGFGGLTTGETNGYVIGAEGALYLDRLTLAGSAFFGGERENDDDEKSGVHVAGTYFFTDNFSVGADVSHYDFDYGGGSEQDGTIYGVNAEYQFANGVSIFGGWHMSDEDYFGSDKEADSFSLGFRYNFGTGSLIARDRDGASMLGVSSLQRAQPFSW